MSTRRKMICLFAFLATALGFWIYSQTVTAQANAPLASVAVCDVHKAVQQYEKTRELRAKFATDTDAVQAEITAANEQITGMREALATSGFLPDSPDYERMREDLVKKTIAIKNLRDIRQRDFGLRDIRIRETCYQDVYKAVQKVALRKNILLVLSKENLTQSSQSLQDLVANIHYRRHLIFADQAIDITAEVIEQLNTDYKLRG